jgi:hypothetical protein
MKTINYYVKQLFLMRLNRFWKNPFPKKIDFLQIGCGTNPKHLHKKAIKNPEKVVMGIDPGISKIRRLFSNEPVNLHLRNWTDLKTLKKLNKQGIKVPEIDFQMSHESLPKLNSEFFDLLDSVLSKNGKISFLTELTEQKVMHYFGGFLRGKRFQFKVEPASQKLINESKSAKGFQKNYPNTKITQYIFQRKNGRAEI